MMGVTSDPPVQTSAAPVPPTLSTSGNPPTTAGSGNPTGPSTSGNPPTTAGSGNPTGSSTSGNPPTTAGSGNPTGPSTSGNPPITAGSGNPTGPSTNGNPPTTAGSGNPTGLSTSGNPPTTTGSGNPTGPSTPGNPPTTTGSGNPTGPSTSGNPPTTAGSGNPTTPPQSSGPPTTIPPTQASTLSTTTQSPTTTKVATTIQQTANPTTTPIPQSTTAANSTTTAEPPTTKAATPVPTTSAAPSCDYSQFGSTHTMLLPPKASCVAHLKEVSAADQAIILATHNNHRAKVAQGNETRGAPGPQPAGANIRELKWNDELAKVAQAWAEQCPSDHDQFNDRKICSRSYSVGQNIYYYWGFDSNTFWKNAIDAWYIEVADTPNSMVSSFTSGSVNGKVIGHYTQVLWANTYEIGCGGVHYSTDLSGTTYPESKIYVCNYGPAGNFLGQEIYTQGTAASQCSNGISTTYPDLCA
ncbi:uncharacterized protein [Palaemon carinicauda]